MGLSEQEASDWALPGIRSDQLGMDAADIKSGRVGRHTAGSGGSDPGSHIRG